MTHQMPSPQPEEQSSQKMDSPKKLHKREQRILERLQEAQAAQARAQERLHRAEARLQKRTQRVQRVEESLALIRRQISGAPPGTPAQDTVEPGAAKEEERPAEQPQVEQQSPATGAGTPEAALPSMRGDEGQAPAAGEMPNGPFSGDVFMEEILQVDAAEHVALPPAYTGNIPEQPVAETEAAAPQESSARPAHRAQEARAAAEAAEENARRAAERSTEVAARVEQMGSGRHLMQELLEAQAEAERASAIAQEAERAAEEAEQEERPFTEPDMTNGDGDADETEPPESQHNEGEDLSSSLEEGAEITSNIPGKQANTLDEIAEIKEEEELVESLAAKSFAEIAAERAASAEAVAEASSVQTREALGRVREAETVLGQVRLAIRDGSLSGEEAEAALQDAENELTRTTAFLADAEATEEQALNNAMNAEAEAEVAEGMADSAERQLEDEQQESLSGTSIPEDAPDEEDNQSATTQKLPVVHPPESL